VSTDLDGRLVHSDSAAETEALGAEVAAELKPGDIALIEGDLGAGKTTLVRGICRALGVTERVTSPTFTIGQVYNAGDGIRVAHLDLYRIADLADEDPALLDDYIRPDSVGLIEWPGAGGEDLRGRAAMVVEIRHAGDNARELLIRRAGNDREPGSRKQ
jgi:tRNA threonylcarbamoyladenosine biosynthesis protein TsaE